MGIKFIDNMKRFWGLLNGPRGWIPQDIQVICDRCSSHEESWSYYGFTFEGWYGVGNTNNFLLLCPECIRKENQKLYPKELSVLEIKLVKNYDKGKTLISFKFKRTIAKEFITKTCRECRKQETIFCRVSQAEREFEKKSWKLYEITGFALCNGCSYKKRLRDGNAKGK